MRKLVSKGNWPSPEDWRDILGRELSERLIADAEEIIRTGAHKERMAHVDGKPTK